MNYREQLSTILDDFTRKFNDALEFDYSQAVKALKPNEPAPQRGKFLSQVLRDSFREEADKLRNDAMSVLDKRAGELNASLAASPTSEAVNAITLLKMRKVISQAEFDAAYSQYGANHFARAALNELAREHSLIPGEAGAEEAELVAIGHLRDTFSHVLTTAAAENGRVSPGAVAFYKMNLNGEI